MRLGFIGLGTMGRPMATNLLRAGHRLAVFARRSDAVQPLAALGAQICDSPAAVARSSEAVFSMVTGDADVTSIALGDDGIVDGAAPGSVVVDMSTIGPETARHIAERLKQRGIDMLDAPVSGGEQGAVDATLAIMVGGPAGVLARVRPALEALGRHIVHIGPSGAGQVAKACNQMIMVTTIQACAEAMRLAAACGVDPACVRAALQGGAAASRVLDVMGERMVTRDFAAGVAARLHHKDIAILMQEAFRLGAPLPLAAQVWQQLNTLMGEGWGRDDTSSLLRILERRSPEP